MPRLGKVSVSGEQERGNLRLGIGEWEFWSLYSVRAFQNLNRSVGVVEYKLGTGNLAVGIEECVF